jgi:hypothetical protein
MVLLVIIVLARHRGSAPVESPAPVATPPVQRPLASPPPTIARPAPPQRSVAPAVPAREAAAGNWRVIAFTFRSHEQASRKAERINERHPELHAAVFSPRGRPGYYLVALGSRMSREEATHLQHKARALGLPRDTYVQNYSE